MLDNVDKKDEIGMNRATSQSRRRQRFFFLQQHRRYKSSMYQFLVAFFLIFSISGPINPAGNYDDPSGCHLQEQKQQSSHQSILFASAFSITRRATKDREEETARTLALRNQELNNTSTSNNMTLNQILIKAGKRGIGGGIPGAIAGAFQVLTLMWLRTIINYQYRYGTTFKGALQTLYNQGGIPRFYRGLWFALIQAPLSRFASTAANDGVEYLLSSLKATETWGVGRGTILSSILVGAFRILIMPVDTCKTVLQVDSAEGFRNLMRKVRAGKINVLYQGALAQALSAVIAHYPWFYTFNLLSKSEMVNSFITSPLLRNASIGFIASLVSDTVSNAIRVVKTTKQAIASKHTVNYAEAVSMVLAADGWKGLFGRGLKTRIIANGFQSVVFTVIWRGLSQKLSSKDGEETEGDVSSSSGNIRKGSNSNDKQETKVA